MNLIIAQYYTTIYSLPVNTLYKDPSYVTFNRREMIDASQDWNILHASK